MSYGYSFFKASLSLGAKIAANKRAARAKQDAFNRKCEAEARAVFRKAMARRIVSKSNNREDCETFRPTGGI